MQPINAALGPLVELLLVCLIGYLTHLVRTQFLPLIQQKMSGDQWAQVQHAARVAVTAVEQIAILSGLKGEAKKAMAMQLATDLLREFDIEIEPSRLATIIEAIVFELQGT